MSSITYLFDEGLAGNGAEERVQFHLHVLQQHWKAKLHGVQDAQKDRLLQVIDLQVL